MEPGEDLGEADLSQVSETRDELDLPPGEYCHYRDEGCEVAAAHLGGHQSRCAECPFPKLPL